MNHYPLATIIVSYKSEERTAKYINQELSKCSLPQIVVVVNNQSTEDSSARIAKIISGVVVRNIQEKVPENCKKFVLDNKENSGYAQGNNLGVKFIEKHFDVEYLLFSNDDILFKDHNVIERLIQKMELCPEVGLMGPKIIGLDGNFQNPYDFVPFWQEVLTIWQRFIPFYNPKQLNKDEAKEGYYYRVMGSFFIARNTDFIQCGMMDPHTFLFYEESILAERMEKIHKKVYYLPSVCVIHAHGGTINALKSSHIDKFNFDSLTYYYKTYRHISSSSIFFAKILYDFYYLLKSWKMKFAQN